MTWRATITCRVFFACRSPARLTARGESPSSHRGGRCARIARRETREYREYLSVEQCREAGCSVRRMQTDFYHGLLRPDAVMPPQDGALLICYRSARCHSIGHRLMMFSLGGPGES